MVQFSSKLSHFSWMNSDRYQFGAKPIIVLGQFEPSLISNCCMLHQKGNCWFLALFSAPMEDRALFNDTHEKSTSNGTVIMSMGKNGAFYSRFDLVLPNKAQVTRDNGQIIIETSNFKLSLAVIFEGSGYLSPRNFCKYYLGYDSFQNHRELKVSIKAEVEFKLLATLKHTNWDYHAWLDGYFEQLEQKMSGAYFFQQINWETASTLIQCGKGLHNQTH